MAGRKPLFDRAMTVTQRRQKNDADKVARGERRLTGWISAEAAAALEAITGGETSRGAIQEAINMALIHTAASVGKRKKRDAT